MPGYERAGGLGAGLSPKTVRSVHGVLHRALVWAVKWEYVPRNVADATDPPVAARTETPSLTADESARLVRAARGHRLEALWIVALYTGCRLGELLGLKWEDVGWSTDSLAVRRTLTGAANGAPTLAEPKTARSRRVVPLSATALAALRAHGDRQAAERQAVGAAYVDFGLVFRTVAGTALGARNVRRTSSASWPRPDCRTASASTTSATPRPPTCSAPASTPSPRRPSSATPSRAPP